ncbi:hypothetical protein HY30_15185 [Hyphomonas chukchiensis]|uniref:Integrase catalytic domain-containing protein n=2 Tax=Hyphomonas TaxID=85 RepID=A0A062UKY4_9PROT|nr:hypothetical protein HY30_15185 [Hyphomonas chukchiensis]KDA00355.1 hypothetical protein HOC_19336 [Hyphomonas oceanitis SCH89]MAL43059.1 hypothetical protein [Hyphomonas sp.]
MDRSGMNANGFVSLTVAIQLLETSRMDYSERRPHTAHNGQSPAEFARNVGLCHAGKAKIAAGF